MKWRYFILLVLFVRSLSHTAQGKGSVKIVIQPYFGQEKLDWEKKYVSTSGDTLQISAFKFYLSSLEFVSDKVKAHSEKNSYHLVDAGDEATCSFILKSVPVNRYDRLAFAIGVDSLKNVSGAFDGELDPAKGMYWAWNTGYIALKLEGTSSSCKTKDLAFEFHIGGYMSPFNTYRKSSIHLKGLQVQKDKMATLILRADVSVLLNGSHPVSLQETNHVVMPDLQAVKLADNYNKLITAEQ